MDQCPTSGVLQLMCPMPAGVGESVAGRELDHLRAESGSLRVTAALVDDSGH